MIVAVCFSILTVIGFAFWRKKSKIKIIENQFNDREMSECGDNTGVVSHFITVLQYCTNMLRGNTLLSQKKWTAKNFILRLHL